MKIIELKKIMFLIKIKLLILFVFTCNIATAQLGGHNDKLLEIVYCEAGYDSLVTCGPIKNIDSIRISSEAKYYNSNHKDLEVSYFVNFSQSKRSMQGDIINDDKFNLIVGFKTKIKDEQFFEIRDLLFQHISNIDMNGSTSISTGSNKHSYEFIPNFENSVKYSSRLSMHQETILYKTVKNLISDILIEYHSQ